jgi:hypothetical protein
MAEKTEAEATDIEGSEVTADGERVYLRLKTDRGVVSISFAESLLRNFLTLVHSSLGSLATPRTEKP